MRLCRTATRPSVYATRGRGGREQQILAVLLTYFSITTSYVPVVINRSIESRNSAVKSLGVQSRPAISLRPGAQIVASMIAFFLYLAVLAAAVPFLALSHGSGVLSSLLIFFAVFRAWSMTAKPELVIMGPYTKTV